MVLPEYVPVYSTMNLQESQIFARVLLFSEVSFKLRDREKGQGK